MKKKKPENSNRAQILLKHPLRSYGASVTPSFLSSAAPSPLLHPRPRNYA